MQIKTITLVSLMAVIVLACTLVLRFTKPGSGNATCKESMADCRKKSKASKPNTNIIWESLSHQFFPASEVTY